MSERQKMTDEELEQSSPECGGAEAKTQTESGYLRCRERWLETLT